MKCTITPLPNENVIAEIEGEMWAASSNPIERFFSGIVKTIAGFLGFRRAGYLLLTDQRIIFVRKEIALWVFPKEAVTASYLPQAVASAGYVRRGTFCGCFCPVFFLEINLISGQSISVQLKGANEAVAAEYANTMYAAISR